MSHHPVNVVQPTDAEILPKLATPEVAARVEELLRRYPVKRAALLQVLWLAQETLDWLPNAAIRWAAGICEVSPVHAYGVSMFYTMYKKEPTGRFFVQICQNVACHILGAEDIIAHAEKTLGVSAHGGTTSDNLFTLLRVECLGACGNGPVMQINDDFATDIVDGKLAMPAGVGLTPERFDRIVAWCRDRAKSTPKEPVRDALGGLFDTMGHPGALLSSSQPQKVYAPVPPALGVSAARTDDNKVKLTWRAAPEVTTLRIEKKAGADFAEVAAIPGKEKEWLDDAPEGVEYRIVTETAQGRGKASNVAKAPAAKGAI
jgi:NADH:ubiquinone oxidoreductase subunit E